MSGGLAPALYGLSTQMAGFAERGDAENENAGEIHILPVPGIVLGHKSSSRGESDSPFYGRAEAEE